MAQIARPVADVRRPQGGNADGWTSPAWSLIDEVIADDGDAAWSPGRPQNEVLVLKLAPLEAPSAGPVVVRYRYGKDVPGGRVDQTVELRCGYYSEGTMGTLIAQWVHEDIAEAWTTAEQTLTPEQVATISDWGDLYLRLIANQAL